MAETAPVVWDIRCGILFYWGCGFIPQAFPVVRKEGVLRVTSRPDVGATNLVTKTTCGLPGVVLSPPRVSKVALSAVDLLGNLAKQQGAMAKHFFHDPAAKVEDGLPRSMAKLGDLIVASLIAKPVGCLAQTPNMSGKP